MGRASFRAPELLFHPHLIGEESEGIHEVGKEGGCDLEVVIPHDTVLSVFQVLAYSIRKSDLDLRKTFYSNIVLSGGSTLFKGEGLFCRDT